MRLRSVVGTGVMLLVACSGRVRNDRGSDRNSSAGSSGSRANSSAGSGGSRANSSAGSGASGGAVVVVEPDYAAGGAPDVSDAGSGGNPHGAGAGGDLVTAGLEDWACDDGDYTFGSNGEGEAGASYGSPSLLAELVGSWKIKSGIADEGDVYEWTINADGTGTYSEQIAAHGSQPARSTVSTGRVHLNEVVLVLDRIKTTVTTGSGTETQAAPEPIVLAYSYDADAHPGTLYLGPPDCGELTYDPYERQ